MKKNVALCIAFGLLLCQSLGEGGTATASADARKAIEIKMSPRQSPNFAALAAQAEKLVQSEGCVVANVTVSLGPEFDKNKILNESELAQCNKVFADRQNHPAIRAHQGSGGRRSFQPRLSCLAAGHADLD